MADCFDMYPGIFPERVAGCAMRLEWPRRPTFASSRTLKDLQMEATYLASELLPYPASTILKGSLIRIFEVEEGG